jgi:hypothetical protein
MRFEKLIEFRNENTQRLAAGIDLELADSWRKCFRFLAVAFARTLPSLGVLKKVLKS